MQSQTTRNNLLSGENVDQMRELGSLIDLLQGSQGGGRLTQLSQLLQQRIAPVEITETQNDYRIVAEVPGLREQEIEITTTGDSVTIRGVKSTQYGQNLGQQQGGQQGGQQTGQGGQSTQGSQNQGQGDQGRLIASERAYGEFNRSFNLPTHVDRERITATCLNGLLTVTVPKSSDARNQQRRIEVRGGQQQNR